ncbi:hypothetical protein FOZ62_002877 [Perkinsus olseni]|uniref:N-acetyltransferase domain-containing protein n=1 Tax=Perkinsus olseni TaxID=32597 RepID=A0A7J6TZ30_PEROL|nr:hypothetical protein FOZ62_002877 [Perkinsus olseni]
MNANQGSYPYDRPIEEVLCLTASEVEYRFWEPGDMMFGSLLPKVKIGQMFVAVAQGAACERAVVGYVDFNEVGVLPFYISSQLPGKRSTDTVVHIANVYVVPEMRNKKIGTKMLSEALHDIRVKSPTVIAAYLFVNPDEHFAVKLYKKLNFTSVTEEDDILLYKYPPRASGGNSWEG